MQEHDFSKNHWFKIYLNIFLNVSEMSHRGKKVNVKNIKKDFQKNNFERAYKRYIEFYRKILVKKCY